MRARKRKMKESSKHNMRLITLVVLVLFGILTYKTVTLKQQVTEYQATLDGYKKDKKKLEKEREEIEDLRDYVETDSYIEEMAREKLGLVYKNEVIFEADDEE